MQPILKQPLIERAVKSQNILALAVRERHLRLSDTRLPRQLLILLKQPHLFSQSRITTNTRIQQHETIHAVRNPVIDVRTNHCDTRGRRRTTIRRIAIRTATSLLLHNPHKRALDTLIPPRQRSPLRRHMNRLLRPASSIKQARNIRGISVHPVNRDRSENRARHRRGYRAVTLRAVLGNRIVINILVKRRSKRRPRSRRRVRNTQAPRRRQRHTSRQRERSGTSNPALRGRQKNALTLTHTLTSSFQPRNL